MGNNRFRMLKSRLRGMEVVLADSAHSFSRHTHDRFGIGVIDRGAQNSLSGRGIVEATAGDVITVNRGEVHDGTPFDAKGRAWRMLYIDCATISAALSDISEGKLSQHEFPLPVTGDDRLRQRFDMLFDAITSSTETSPLLCEDRLLRLVEAAMRESPASKGSLSATGAIGRARDLIDDDPARALTLGDLARECGLSRFQLVRAFAEVTGMTPHAYLIQRRVALARRLIAGGQQLAEVALACGFSDQSHMTRLFIRQNGISPGVYAEATR
ncbi:AraC family transcriptional regulator [Rhizobium sp. ARZ01]|uniref:AraC family transcriptional regulator n=1 Tax=Rhizobium sp. ARZ01 TaxID=2769313 RepID=UPI0017819C56|nr:AraC family transcriptional regulator [Rhizobium sp. ARZ01]MBD9374104.1 AraC family transcriptional regulator [Rhizobium sp. ARZ01]